VKIHTVILVTLLALSSSLAAQTTYRITPEELFEKGLQNSVAIRASALRTKISEENLGAAKNMRLPDISATGSFGYAGTPVIMGKDLAFLRRSESPDWRQNYQAAASQPIYRGGAIKGSIERARLEEEIARLALQEDRSALKLWLIGQYLDLFNLYKEREVYSKNIEEAQIRLRDIERMREQGMVTNNDVLRSRLLLTNYELSLRETENNIALVSQQLDIVMGMDENTILEPDGELPAEQPQVRSEGDYVDLAYWQSPTMRIAETNVALARNEWKLARADYLPSLSLQVSNVLTRPIPNASPPQDLFLNSWGVTLNLSYNFTSLFRKKHNMNAATFRTGLQELALEQQRQDVRTGIRAAHVKHVEALERVRVLEESVAQAEENYRIVKNKYYNQLAILTDLLDAGTVQLDSELQLTAARTTVIYTYYQLLNTSGTL
jgi:outer membrane protein TolC